MTGRRAVRRGPNARQLSMALGVDMASISSATNRQFSTSNTVWSAASSLPLSTSRKRTAPTLPEDEDSNVTEGTVHKRTRTNQNQTVAQSEDDEPMETEWNTNPTFSVRRNLYFF
jgi:hypothetical protein